MVARRAPDGTTTLPVLRAEGALAVRRTGPGAVHLVGTAAGPLGGDEVEVVLRVEAGARLLVRQVAASLVLPGHREVASQAHVVAEVAAGGLLDLAWEPAIVTALARHATRTSVVLDGDAAVRLLEQVQLGRWGEAEGHWQGRIDVERDGRAVLRHALALGPGSPAWDALDSPRALLSLLDVPGAGGAAGTNGGAVRMPLAAGGTLVSATGPDLSAARRDARAA